MDRASHERGPKLEDLNSISIRVSRSRFYAWADGPVREPIVDREREKERERRDFSRTRVNVTENSGHTATFIPGWTHLTRTPTLSGEITVKRGEKGFESYVRNSRSARARVNASRTSRRARQRLFSRRFDSSSLMKIQTFRDTPRRGNYFSFNERGIRRVGVCGERYGWKSRIVVTFRIR